MGQLVDRSILLRLVCDRWSLAIRMFRALYCSQSPSRLLQAPFGVVSFTSPRPRRLSRNWNHSKTASTIKYLQSKGRPQLSYLDVLFMLHHLSSFLFSLSSFGKTTFSPSFKVMPLRARQIIASFFTCSIIESGPKNVRHLKRFQSLQTHVQKSPLWKSWQLGCYSISWPDLKIVPMRLCDCKTRFCISLIYNTTFAYNASMEFVQNWRPFLLKCWRIYNNTRLRISKDLDDILSTSKPFQAFSHAPRTVPKGLRLGHLSENQFLILQKFISSRSWPISLTRHRTP